jgi:hypothetical protein
MNWYNSALQAAFDGSGVDLSTADVRVAFVDSGYTADLTDGGDEFLSDVKAAGTVLTTSDLSNVSWSTRVLDADDPTITDPGSGEATQAVVYIDTGTDSTSRLLGHTDTASGLPLTFDGTNDNLTFNASGILKLGS